jgi:hypothetical protein
VPIFKRNDKIGFYAHIPKTGGSSVTKFLKEFGCFVFLDGQNISQIKNFSGIVKYNNFLKSIHRGSPCTPQHIHNYFYNHVMDMSKVDFTFSVVRHPEERIISEFYWSNCTFTTDSKDASGLTKYDKSKWVKTNDFSLWLKNSYECYHKDNYVWDNHLRKQSDFIWHDMKLFKFEDINEVPNYINEKMGAPYSEIKMPYTNKSRNKTEINIEKEDKKILEEWYKDDYDLYHSIKK